MKILGRHLIYQPFLSGREQLRKAEAQESQVFDLTRTC